MEVSGQLHASGLEPPIIQPVAQIYTTELTFRAKLTAVNCPVFFHGLTRKSSLSYDKAFKASEGNYRIKETWQRKPIHCLVKYATDTNRCLFSTMIDDIYIHSSWLHSNKIYKEHQHRNIRTINSKCW
jgi:hypothetical protein